MRFNGQSLIKLKSQLITCSILIEFPCSYGQGESELAIPVRYKFDLINLLSFSCTEVFIARNRRFALTPLRHTLKVKTTATSPLQPAEMQFQRCKQSPTDTTASHRARRRREEDETVFSPPNIDLIGSQTPLRALDPNGGTSPFLPGPSIIGDAQQWSRQHHPFRLQERRPSEMVDEKGERSTGLRDKSE